MKRRILIIATIMAMLICMLAISVSAASTNEFGTVETSDKIDLTGMATDSDVKVVLFDGTEYHTYPSQYIVTSATDITLSFAKINEAFGTSYDLKSVIRIEIPRHVLKIDSGDFNYGKNNNLKEVFFPVDSKLTEIAWGAFEQNSGLEKINFPKSLQNIGNNAFCKCTSLKYVTFAEDSTITEIKGEKVFYECKSLEELVLPNSLVKVGNSIIGVAAKIKKIVLGANMETLPGAMSDINPKGTVIYFSAKFYAPSVTSEPPANMFHWAGAGGQNNNPKYLTFVYTGTKEQAEALQARFGKVDGLQRLSQATLCSVSEYTELTGLEVGVGSQTGNYLIYGYSACDAFYNGVHDVQKVNDCADKCTRCDKIVLNENPVHKLSYDCTFANGFNEDGNLHEYCSNQYCEYTKDTKVDKIFDFSGYSVKENEPTAICASFIVNHKSLDLYKEHNENVTIEYGFIAKKSTDDNAVLEYKDGSIVSNAEKTIVVPIESTYSGFDFVLRGFNLDGSQDNVELVISAYIGNGSDIFYMSNTYGDAPETTTLSQARQ